MLQALHRCVAMSPSCLEALSDALFWKIQEEEINGKNAPMGGERSMVGCAIEARSRLLRERNPLVARWLKQHLTFRRKV